MRNSSSLDQLDTTISAKQECVSGVKSWLTLNRLQLNDGKTEAMLVVSKRASTSGLIPQSMRIGDTDVDFSDLVKNLKCDTRQQLIYAPTGDKYLHSSVH